MALGQAGAAEDDETTEDHINRIMESKKLLSNASYFAFTATPKNKTLEIFGTPVPDGEHTRHAPFHAYTMKQAIQEGFIIDVLARYTPVASYYRLIKTVEGDPEFDTKRAGKKLRRYVEDHDHAVRLKAEIMVDHFHEQVAGLQKIGGQARAMVVTSSIRRAVSYYHAIRAYLTARKSSYQAIVAFSGEHEFDGTNVTEASLNGFSSNLIAEKHPGGPVSLPGLRRQVPDRLRRAVAAHDVRGQGSVRRQGGADAVTPQPGPPQEARRLRAGLQQRRRHDRGRLCGLLPDHGSGRGDRSRQAARPDGGAGRLIRSTTRRRSSSSSSSIWRAPIAAELDPILDACVAVYREELDEDGQVDFKGKAKAFLRAYGFLAAILPFTNAEWEKLSIFLTFLVPKLPAPVEDDLSKGILEAIDMDSYRVEKQAVRDIQLPDEDAEIEPVPTDGGGQKPDPEMDRLSNIIKEFNDRLRRYIEWNDQDKIERLISEELPAKVAADQAYQNAIANSDAQNARIEHDKALERRDDRADRRPHGVVQAVQRQRVIPPVVVRDALHPDLQPSGRTRRRPEAIVTSSAHHGCR